MAEFIAGQRWISDTEQQLGLGTVLRSDARSVMVLFLATGDTRTYARTNAPLTRVEFAGGDSIQCHEGWWLTVESVSNKQGILTYHGTREDGSKSSLDESQLANHIQLNKPQDRLLTGAVDASKWFELRVLANQLGLKLSQSKTFGFVGARTDLLPHQLYIAHDVANRFAPRVLLADEVGLGKTIEAGLILHQQLLTERAQRALVIVPETLAHQWLVEMLRRFNLHFRFYDEERCKAVEESEDVENPFTTDQLVLCTREFLCNNQTRLDHAIQAGWDLLIVDEAHHLHWSQEHSNKEYQVVEQLTRSTKGVLLLTGTPEQAGVASHFARLRLLDPARFPDLQLFIEESQQFIPLAQAIEELSNQRTLSPETRNLINNTIGESDNLSLFQALESETNSVDEKSHARQRLIDHLLDRHGTSRVLFRNTRGSVKGFPQRKMEAYSLRFPEEYYRALQETKSTHIAEPQLLLCPELLYQRFDPSGTKPWFDFDPRVEWLHQTLKRLKNEKVLIIAAKAQTALDLETLLRHKKGLRVAVFHEGLTIVERDRAAVYFAQQEDGAQALICSEIGSEGRNFQFAHHLVLFDLPWNPDLLEQRIGRLDRIGQTHTIQIHVPYLENCAQTVLFHWYHHGLNAFDQFCAAGATVFNKFKPSLIQAMQQVELAPDELSDLVETTRALTAQMNQALHDGRDRLLEYQSFRPHQAQQIIESIQAQDDGVELQNFLDRVFDCFGIDIEEHNANSFIVRPAEHLQSSQIPGLPDDGMTITFDRKTALSNDPYQFMTWEHPFTQNAIDMVVTNEKGNSCVVTYNNSNLKPGTTLLEAFFVLEAMAEGSLQISRYLPPTFIRVLLNKNGGKNLANQLKHEHINKNVANVDAAIATKVVRAQGAELRQLIKAAREHAQQAVPALVEQSKKQFIETLSEEINRLTVLREVNPNVRDEEIDFFRNQLAGLTKAAEKSTLRLDALRLLIAT